jgi:putative aldouronate transport system substrate-binding protein
MYDVTTYSDEMMIKFIMGVEPLSNYPKYQAQIRKLGIERAVAIMQEALAGYKRRK